MIGSSPIRPDAVAKATGAFPYAGDLTAPGIRLTWSKPAMTRFLGSGE